MSAFAIAIGFFVVVTLAVAIGVGAMHHNATTEGGVAAGSDGLDTTGVEADPVESEPIESEAITAGPVGDGSSGGEDEVYIGSGRELTWENLREANAGDSAAVTILRREGVTLDELVELYREGEISSVSGIGQARAEDLIEAVSTFDVSQETAVS